MTRPLGAAARRIEKAAFVTAATAYLLPFFDAHVPLISPVLGLQVFFAALIALTTGPWPWAFLVFAAFGRPLITATAGFLSRRKENWLGAVAGLTLAGVGFLGLAVGFFGSSTGRLGYGIGFGFWAAEAAFLVAAVAIIVLRGAGVEEPPINEPAESAMQELVGRYRSTGNATSSSAILHRSRAHERGELHRGWAHFDEPNGSLRCG